MTAAATTAGGRTGAPVREWLALRAPAEGWLSVGLVLLLSLTVAWSIDDAAWVRGQEGLTDFLTWTAALGVAAGLVGAKIGWPRWLAHLAGAIWAAILVPLIVGTVLLPEAGSLGETFRATADSARLAFVDLAILNRAVTTQYGHFLLILGLFSWATGQYAAGAVFRDHRPLDAAVLTGLLLLANMSLTIHDQLPYLVVFSLAALFLLIRAHAFDEQVVWLRRRIGDPSELATFYLRGGTFFVGAAVAGALVLTSVAASNPLGGALIGAQQTLIDFGRSLERFLPVGGTSRSGGVSFGATARISGRWVTNGNLAVTIQVQPGEQERFYWRAVTYDVFDLVLWRPSDTERVDVEAGTSIFRGTLDDVSLEGRRPIGFTVHRDGFGGSVVFSPQTPISVDRPATVVLVDGQFFSSLEVGADDYTVTALIPVKGERDPLGLTENRLRVAGTDYPPEVVERYLGVPDGAIGPEARQLLDDILALSPSDRPFDIARTMVEVLQGPRFSYQVDVTGLEPVSDSIVEMFAHYRIGYCEYYASTMAVLLREAGIPTRLAEGFLPGDRDLGSGIERIYNDGAHAWVEVYFPRYGWVPFDPTGGGRSRLTALPSGQPEASPPAGASGSGVLPEPTIQDNTIGDQEPDDGGLTGGGTIDRPTDPGPFIALALILLLVVAGLAVAVWLRGPRGEIGADQAWRSISRLAGRFGFGPRPTETAYEYAGSMAAVLPDARPALQTVARAKVEVAYGRQELGHDRLRALREAERRLRLEFLRLVFRRGDRRRPR